MNLLAQNGLGGIPYSKTEFCPQQVASRMIPFDLNNSFDPEVLIGEDALGSAYRSRAGVVYDRDLTLNNSGIWDTLPNNDRLWRITLRAPGATGLIIHFDDFRLGSGATLHLYADTTLIVGTFNHLDNNPSGRYSILFPDSVVTIELYEPDSLGLDTTLLRIGRIGYLFRVALDGEECTKDVACYSDYTDQSRSVAKLYVTVNGAVYQSTGALVNNTCNNGDLLFLTAFHSIDVDTNITISDEEIDAVADMLLYFDDKRAVCNGSTFANEYQLSGASILQTCSSADMVLLRLFGPVPENANPHLSGWDEFGGDEWPAFTIHHPDGMGQKISRDTTNIQVYQNQNADPYATMVGTQMWYADFDSLSRVYKGSSGAPLYNTLTRNLIGVLSVTANPTTICHSPVVNNYAFFGRLSTAMADCSFRPFLNPAESGEGGSTQWDGIFYNDRDTDSPCDEAMMNPDCVNEDHNETTCYWNWDSSPSRFIDGVVYDDVNYSYYAFSSISTGRDGNGNGVLIKANSDVRYLAYDLIEIGDGFTVEEGGRFSAETGYCCTDGWHLTDNRMGTEDESGREFKNRTKGLEKKPALYPNPTTGLITYNGTAPLASATVMDLTGRALHTVSLSGVEGPVNIDLSPYRPGTYLLRIQYQSGKVEVQRVVRQ